MELTSHLKLLQWIIKHTYINNDPSRAISNKEIQNIFFKEFPETRQDIEKEINILIGNFLNYVYGQELIRFGSNPVKYNIGLVKNPIKEIFIRDYKEVYNINFFKHSNKKSFENARQTHKTVNRFFKHDKFNMLHFKDFIKCDNLAKDIIIYCLNKGIPKEYLKYFLFYTMCFLNPRDLNLLLTKQKQEFKKNKVCAVCGSSENLTIHHYKKVSKAPYLEFNNNNFIVLCAKCHKLHHQRQDKGTANNFIKGVVL